MRTLMILLLVGTAWAVTRHVPSEYPSIQSALDAVQNGDTVLVALGTYAEALHAPGQSFVLRGDVTSDTGDYPRPVIDPSTLPNPRTRTCLSLASLATPRTVVIEDLHFRNGAAMYPHDDPLTGGVIGGDPSTTLRRCLVDSTAGGYLPGYRGIQMDRCEFRNIQGPCIVWTQGFWLRATDCVFHGRDLFNIQVSDSSHFLRCHFLGNASGSLCSVIGRDIQVEDCIFGPSLPGEASWDPALWIMQPQGIVQNNVFEGVRLGIAAIRVDCACNDTDIVIIRKNRILNNVVETYQGSAAIYVSHDNGDSVLCNAVIDSNSWWGNGGNILSFEGLFLNADARVSHNRFSHFPQITAPTALVRPQFDWGLFAGYEIHANVFDTLCKAVVVSHAVDTLDARWNWWGDATGPYNADSNPNGRGDTVSAYVNFTPWCTDTMTCEEPNATPDRNFISHPSAFTLAAFPNPFNSTTVIRLEVPQAEIVRVELFDILGRRVKELWAGAVADEKEITFDGSELASGVYFVRATNTIWNRPLVSTKIVLLK